MIIRLLTWWHRLPYSTKTFFGQAFFALGTAWCIGLWCGIILMRWGH